MNNKTYNVVLQVAGFVISAIGVMLGNLPLFIIGDAILLFVYHNWDYLIDIVWFMMFIFTFAMCIAWLMLSDTGFALLMCDEYHICLPPTMHTGINNGILVVIFLAVVLTWIVGYISVNRLYTGKDTLWIRVGRYLSPFFVGLIIEGMGRFNLAINIVKQSRSTVQ